MGKKHLIYFFGFLTLVYFGYKERSLVFTKPLNFLLDMGAIIGVTLFLLYVTYLSEK